MAVLLLNAASFDSAFVNVTMLQVDPGRGGDGQFGAVALTVSGSVSQHESAGAATSESEAATAGDLLLLFLFDM